MTVGIIGGSGFYQFPNLTNTAEVEVITPFASTVVVTRGQIATREVAFIARHGAEHKVPPHKVAYRANIWALKSVGVTHIFALNAVGGIGDNMAPGVRVLPHQLIDYTYGREHSFADVLGDDLNHIDFTEPFSERLRGVLQQVWRAAGVEFVDHAVVGCTQGPRLETAAEVQRLKRDGCDLVGMTTMPEAALARELGMDYAAICTVVNWAAGISVAPITLAHIHQILRDAKPLLCQTLVDTINAL